jgi:hypothetical protein
MPIWLEGKPHAALKAERQLLLNFEQPPVVDGMIHLSSYVLARNLAGLQKHNRLTSSRTLFWRLFQQHCSFLNNMGP